MLHQNATCCFPISKLTCFQAQCCKVLLSIAFPFWSSKDCACSISHHLACRSPCIVLVLTTSVFWRFKDLQPGLQYVEDILIEGGNKKCIVLAVGGERNRINTLTISKQPLWILMRELGRERGKLAVLWENSPFRPSPSPLQLNFQVAFLDFDQRNGGPIT